MLQHAQHNSLHHGLWGKITETLHKSAFWATALILAILAALIALGFILGGQGTETQIQYPLTVYPYIL